MYSHSMATSQLCGCFSGLLPHKKSCTEWWRTEVGGGDGRKEGSKVSKEEREATGSPAIMF